ncbi:YjcZ family sporulation protein [Domibacillus sp. 8LH]
MSCENNGGYGYGSGFALIVVLFILLIIIGVSYVGGEYGGGGYC